MINEAPRAVTQKECAWLKVPLTLVALQRGYDWLLFLDADCEIRAHTPRIESVAVEDRYFYLVEGFSGRFNSGVFICHNDERVRHFFRCVLDSADEAMPPEDAKDILYENGHIIHHAKNFPYIEALGTEWNNNRSVDPTSFVQHYSKGILRPGYLPSQSNPRKSTLGRIWARISRLNRKPALNTKGLSGEGNLTQRLSELTDFYVRTCVLLQPDHPKSTAVQNSN